MRALIPALMGAVLLGAPARAQEPADPGCAAVRVALPPELKGWSDQTPVSAGIKAGDGATIEIGRAALVSLHPAKLLGFRLPPSRAGDTSGGTLALAVAKGGTYRVALGNDAWIDLVQSGKPVASKAHAHGPKCGGVRKIVDFALAPGNYTVQLSGSASDTVALLIARVG